MDSTLQQVWQASSVDPLTGFAPAVSKGNQFLVAFFLLLIGITSTGLFALNRSFSNIIVLGVPASLTLALGTVYMFCAVGVYV